jgi:hypothetical protein
MNSALRASRQHRRPRQEPARGARLPFGPALLLAAVVCLGAAPRPAQATVRAEVIVIHATGGPGAGPSIDPALTALADYLTRSFGARYSSFRQLDRQTLALDVQERGTLELPGDRELALTFKGVKDDFIRLFMELPHLKTTVKVRDGGLFFQAGTSYQGGMLILAIRVHLT